MIGPGWYVIESRMWQQRDDAGDVELPASVVADALVRELNRNPYYEPIPAESKQAN